MEIANYVNESPPFAKIGDISDYIKPVNTLNAIDQFRLGIKETVEYGTMNRLDDCDFLGRLLVLRLVSCSEAYFRRILSDTLRLCPMARSHASEKQINLGGLLWHGKERYSLSAFDNTSFSSSKELKSGSLGYVKFQLEDAIFKSLLIEYDRVCNIRHSIIHADGIVPGRNAVLLGIPPIDGQVEIVIKYDEIQEAASVVSTLVATYNRELFAVLCERWAIGWRKRPEWKTEDEDKLFIAIWGSFFSRIDHSIRPGRSKITRSACMAAVKAEFGI